MPEGLANNMTVQDFRDLVRYVMAHPFVAGVRVAGPYDAANRPAWDPASPKESRNSEWKNVISPVGGRIVLPPSKDAATAYVSADVTAPGSIKAGCCWELRNPSRCG